MAEVTIGWAMDLGQAVMSWLFYTWNLWNIPYFLGLQTPTKTKVFSNQNRFVIWIPGTFLAS